MKMTWVGLKLTSFRLVFCANRMRNQSPLETQTISLTQTALKLTKSRDEPILALKLLQRTYQRLMKNLLTLVQFV